MELLEDRALTLFRNRAFTPDLTKTFDFKIKLSLIKQQKDEKYSVKSYHSCLEIQCDDSASLFEPFTCETKVAESRRIRCKVLPASHCCCYSSETEMTQDIIRGNVLFRVRIGSELEMRHGLNC